MTVRRSAAAIPLLLLTWLVSADRVRAGEVVALVSAPVAAYAQALEGFRQGLGSDRNIVVRQLDGSVARGREILAAGGPKPDLVFAVGLWALQAALDRPTGAPIVYAMVLNPASVVGSARDVTGASMNVPVAENLRLLRRLGPSIRRIGLVFNETKTGYLVPEARRLAASLGLELVAVSAATPGDAIRAFDALQAQGIDAFWYLPDETLLAAPVAKHVFLGAHRGGIPILGISERQAEMGALFALTFASSEDVGRQAGELARAVLDGKRPAEVPATAARSLSLTVNLKTARKLRVAIPESILADADQLIE